MNITRNEKSKCVMARIRRGGFRHQGNFTLKEYGSWESAENEAKKWVKEMLKELPPRTTVKDIITRRNNSGVAGVQLAKTKNIRGHNVYHYERWVAHWPGCPNPGGVGFSTNQFGEENSFVLAVIARRNETIDRQKIIKMLEKIQGTEEYNEILSQKKQ